MVDERTSTNRLGLRSNANVRTVVSSQCPVVVCNVTPRLPMTLPPQDTLYNQLQQRIPNNY